MSGQGSRHRGRTHDDQSRRKKNALIRIGKLGWQDEYLRNFLDNAKILPAKETLTLVKRYQAGDTEVGNQLIPCYARMVMKIIGKKARSLGIRAHNLDDFFQVGCLGILYACKTYSPAKEACLSTWVWEIIGNYLKVEFTNRGRTIRIPSHKIWNQTVNGKPTKDKELWEYPRVMTYYDSTDGENLREDGNRSISPLVAKGMKIPQDKYNPVRLVMEKEDRNYARRIIKRLPGRYRVALTLRYVKHRSMEETAEHFSMDRYTYRRLEARAMNHLKQIISTVDGKNDK